jgi:FkbH-like protein
VRSTPAQESFLKVLLISDFNVQNLAHLLTNDVNQPLCTVETAAFGQVVSALGSPATTADFAFVWTMADKTIPAFSHLLSGEAVDERQLRNEVHDFAEQVAVGAAKFRALFLASWVVPPYWRRRSITDLQQGRLKNALMRMNLQLAEELAGSSGVHLLDAQDWMGAAGRKSFSPKLWYLTKTPFQSEVFEEVVRDIKAGISGLLGQSRKLIILDLDNTLWGGTVGDCGWQNVRVGGHDYVGEAFADFQKALKLLSKAGVLLAVASKNEEAVAFDAINQHPEMILRAHDFAGWRINWKDKAGNISELAQELNIGLQSIVFIDDNPTERVRVREALPEVYVPEWPADPTSFASYLFQMPCFEMPYTTLEDRLRTTSYSSERARERLRQTFDSQERWLLSLDTHVTVESLNDVNLPRFVQLLNKTNQMNLTTRRMTDVQVLQWSEKHSARFWTFRVRDRCGDSGLTGIVGIELNGNTARLSDFVLSCRVMGRNIERAMLAAAVEYCRSRGLQELVAIYVPTAKNKPCLDFWLNSGFTFNSANQGFVWQLDKVYPFPSGITLTSLVDRQPQQPEADWVASSSADDLRDISAEPRRF